MDNELKEILLSIKTTLFAILLVLCMMLYGILVVIGIEYSTKLSEIIIVAGAVAGIGFIIINGICDKLSKYIKSRKAQ